MIVREIPVATFPAFAPTAELSAANPSDRLKFSKGEGQSGNSFTLLLTMNFRKVPMNVSLLSVEGVLNVSTRFNRYGGEQLDDAYGYSGFTDATGESPVIEAVLQLDQWTQHNVQSKSLTIGVPIEVLPKDDADHELVLDFDGVKFTLFLDGRRMDQNFPYGFPKWLDMLPWRINPKGVKSAKLFIPGLHPEIKLETVSDKGSGHGFLPHEWNAWVGDVTMFSHEGRLHVFYLYDRRHHSNKFCAAGHYWGHVVSDDLKTWTDYGDAISFDQQWETFGTGTPFFWKGKYYMSFGYHSARVVGGRPTLIQEQRAFLERTGETAVIDCAKTPFIPVGATYAVSDDGIHFTKSGKLFHPAENISIYPMPDGSLRLISGYGDSSIWESDHLGGFRCIHKGFPPVEDKSFMRNSGDCPCWFEWHGYHYMLVGTTGFWRAKDALFTQEVRDLAAEGRDIYDGSWVPMVVSLGARRIIGGWIGVYGYAGPLCLRELVYFPDGVLGSKWLSEAMPAAKTAKPLAEKLSSSELLQPKSFSSEASDCYVTMKIVPRKDGGMFAIRFFDPADPAKTGEFRLDFSKGQAQWNISPSPSLFAKKIMSNREWAESRSKDENVPRYIDLQRPYCVEKLSGLDKEFELKLLLRYSRKLNGTLVDAEIAGCRTLIGLCKRVKPWTLAFAASEDASFEVKDLATSEAEA